ncbi:MAG: S1 RNA-binding domain-containing protein [Myxococcota bacterium]
MKELPVRRRRAPADDAPPAPEKPVDAPAPRLDAPPPAPPAPRVPTDLEGLRQVAEMDRSEIDALLAEFSPRKGAERLHKGQRVRGRVTRVTGSTVFVDVGEKADASIERFELDADVAPGDALDAFVIVAREGEVRLTRSLGGDATREMLDAARDERIPVQGKVVGHNEHGLEVQLSGGVRAFCPTSQVEAGGAPYEAEAWVGRTVTFRVLDVRGREAVVSHRAIADLEAQEAQTRTLAEVKEGDVFEGTVTKLADFGAFVKLPNGLEGLVHLSNLANKRISKAADVVQAGQQVRVRVLAVDTARRRLSLGIKQAEDAVAPVPAGERSQGGSFGTLGSLLGAVKVRK